MYRISALIRTIACAVLLLASTALPLRAQTEFPLPTELPIQGERPFFEWEKPVWFAMDESGTNWVITTENVWSLSLDSLKWNRWPKIQFDDIDIQPGYDMANKRFLFWNFGVGKVFTWNPGDTTVQRIDKSYHHRTQFGHAWFIHPKTGEIYAFGGQGFWTSRGYTVRFDYENLHWLVVPLDPTKPFPSPRASSLHTYDEKRNQFHIFGGHDYRHEGREDLSVDLIDFDDYWVLDIERREWKQHPVFGPDGNFDTNKELRRRQANWYKGVSDQANDLAWYPVRRTTDAHDIQLMVFDYRRNFGAYLPISLGDLGHKSHTFMYGYDQKSNRLLIGWVEALAEYGRVNLRVSALPLPHPDSTRALMDLVREHGSIYPPATASNTWMWLLLLLIPAMAAGWMWNRRRAHPTAEPRESGSAIAPPLPAVVTFCMIGEPRLKLNGVDVRNHFTDLEFEMLFWLYWKHRKGESFQVTDVIENVFWHDSPNLDYIRKQRNTTLRRLNEQLAHIFGEDAADHEWIVDKVSISDKRKREYALDLNGFVVQCDLDEVEPESVDPSQLLESCSGIWVEQIRGDYATVSVAS